MSWLHAVPELLEVARGSLRDAVLPAVAAERRYEAAMVASALGIAARELRQGAAAREAERQELGALLGQPEAGLESLRHQLCRELRAGTLPPAVEKQLPELLLAAVRRRLAVSNPDHLTRSGS